MLNGSRGGSATFKVNDPKVRKRITAESTALLERVLVAEEDGNAVYAGIILDVEEDLDAGTMTIQHQDAAWWILARRYLLNLRGEGAPAGGAITWTNRTLASLAFLIVDKGMDGGPADRYNLPIVLTADVAGTHSRTYEAYNFWTVERALQEIIKADGGPYIDFDVHWNAGQLEWGMRAGELTTGLWSWDATASKTQVSQPKLRSNAENVANRVIGTGEGQGEDMKSKSAESFAGSTAPALERVTSYQNMTTPEQLQERTTADLNTSNQPVKQFSFRIPIGGKIKLGDLILGGTCRVKTSGFTHLDAGWHDWRLIQYDFDRNWITMQMQQIGG